MSQKRTFRALLNRINPSKIGKYSTDSYKWFNSFIKGVQLKRNDVMRSKNFERVSKPVIGGMYSFVYDAKHKDTLPYFDAFPLIMMVGPAQGGFYGINFHYLPVTLRAKLFDNIMDIANNRKFDDTTKVKVTYSMLNSMSKMRYFKPCFKHYLYSQVGSKLIKIEPKDWRTAMFMPTQNFVGANAKTVWKDSRNYV